MLWLIHDEVGWAVVDGATTLMQEAVVDEGTTYDTTAEISEIIGWAVVCSTNLFSLWCI